MQIGFSLFHVAQKKLSKHTSKLAEITLTCSFSLAGISEGSLLECVVHSLRVEIKFA